MNWIIIVALLLISVCAGSIEVLGDALRYRSLQRRLGEGWGRHGGGFAR